jgi:hypothetical protein
MVVPVPPRRVRVKTRGNEGGSGSQSPDPSSRRRQPIGSFNESAECLSLSRDDVSKPALDASQSPTRAPPWRHPSLVPGALAHRGRGRPRDIMLSAHRHHRDQHRSDELLLPLAHGNDVTVADCPRAAGLRHAPARGIADHTHHAAVKTPCPFLPRHHDVVKPLGVGIPLLLLLPQRPPPLACRLLE